LKANIPWTTADGQYAMYVYIDNCTISVTFKKRDATLKPRLIINMIMPVGIIMLMIGGFIERRLMHDTCPCLHHWQRRIYNWYEI